MFIARPLRPGFETRKRLLLTARHTIRGEYSARFLNPDGSPTLADITRSDGHERRSHELALRKNLITNAWLDGMASYPADTLRGWLRVGTGSGTPAVTDISLDAEVEAGDETPSTGTDRVVSSIEADEFYEVAITRSRRATMTESRNLTEFGLSRLADSDLNVRNLFRDETDTPVTISLLAGKMIEVKHTVYYKYPRFGVLDSLTVEERDATDTLVSTTTYDCELGYFASSGHTLTAFDSPSMVSGLGNWNYGYRTTDAGAQGTSVMSAATILAGVGVGVQMFPDAGYVAGTHYLDSLATTALVTQGNATYTMISVFRGTLGPFNGSGLGARFLNPGTFQKLSTHELALPTFRVSWAREA